MIKLALRFLLVLLIVGFFASAKSPQTLAAGVGNDNWVAASSVGMGGNNYAAFTGYNGGLSTPSDTACFGGWADSQTDAVIGCNSDTTTYSPTMFDSGNRVHAEHHVATIRAFPGDDNHSQTITANAYFDPRARPTFHQNRLYETGRMTNAGYVLDPTAFYEDYSPPNLWNVNKINALIWFNNNLYAGLWSPSTSGSSGNESSQGLEIWKHPAFDPNDPWWKNHDDSYLVTIQNQWQRVVNAGQGSTRNEGVMHMFIYNNALYASVFNHTDGPKLLRTTDGNSWSWVDTNIAGNANYIVSTVMYQGKLIAGLANGGVYTANNSSLTSWTLYPGYDHGIGHALTVSRDGKTLYAGGRFSGEIYKSIEGAAFELSKRLARPTGQQMDIGVYSLVTTGNRVWAGTGNVPFWRGENANEFYYSNPRSAQVWCLGCAAPPPRVPTLEIELPPSGLMSIQSFKFGGYVCDMSQANFNPASCDNNGHGWHFSRDLISSDDPGSTTDDRYVIRVTGFTKGDGLSYNNPSKTLAWLQSLTSASAFAPPPASSICTILPSACNGGGALPYGYQVTFKGTTVSNINTGLNYVNYLQSNPLFHAYLADANCDANQGTKSYLCMRTQVKLSVPENEPTPQKDPTVYLVQRVSAGQGGVIQFEGNVAGNGTLSGFGFTDPKAVAVGGNVTGVQGTNKLSGYVTSSTKLGWDDISGGLNNVFAKKTTGTIFTPSTYSAATWNLNSSSNDPQVGAKSSFSTPPEGKLWWVKDHGLTFTGDVSFNGRGTIAVDGDVTFNGNVSCTAQVGIIATGSITFTKDNLNVGCGAFTSLNGDVTFTKPVTSGTNHWTGIFVAARDINLPRLTGGALVIHYDTGMNSNPTVLFKELLKILFTTSS